MSTSRLPTLALLGGLAVIAVGAAWMLMPAVPTRPTPEPVDAPPRVASAPKAEPRVLALPDARPPSERSQAPPPPRPDRAERPEPSPEELQRNAKAAGARDRYLQDAQARLELSTDILLDAELLAPDQVEPFQAMMMHQAHETARLKEELVAAGLPKDEAARRHEEVRRQSEHALIDLLGPEGAAEAKVLLRAEVTPPPPE